ncbi:MAG: type II toxin-antitoxin system HicB family antitoxin [Anaerolineales bacterium]|nr:type II toxin-antitoxin system HicB family antitoxin [Anaerolineales bacterium]
MNTLNYKDYEGTAEIDTERNVCRGKILFISDLITYEAATPYDLQKEFQAAVDDYIETCKELGREPQKPLKGQFNIRISPELHRQATSKSIRDDVSLNEVVKKALECYLNSTHDVNHHHKVTFVSTDNQNLLRITSAMNQWSTIKTTENNNVH